MRDLNKKKLRLTNQKVIQNLRLENLVCFYISEWYPINESILICTSKYFESGNKADRISLKKHNYSVLELYEQIRFEDSS